MYVCVRGRERERKRGREENEKGGGVEGSDYLGLEGPPNRILGFTIFEDDPPARTLSYERIAGSLAGLPSGDGPFRGELDGEFAQRLLREVRRVRPTVLGRLDGVM